MQKRAHYRASPSDIEPIRESPTGGPPTPSAIATDAFCTSYCPAFCEVPAPSSPLPPNACTPGGPHEPFWHPPNPLAPPIGDPGAAAAETESVVSSDEEEDGAGGRRYRCACAVSSSTRLKLLSSHVAMLHSSAGESCGHDFVLGLDSSFEATSLSTPSAPHTPANSCERSVDSAASTAAVAAAAGGRTAALSRQGSAGVAPPKLHKSWSAAERGKKAPHAAEAHNGANSCMNLHNSQLAAIIGRCFCASRESDVGTSTSHHSGHACRHAVHRLQERRIPRPAMAQYRNT